MGPAGGELRGRQMGTLARGCRVLSCRVLGVCAELEVSYGLEFD